MNENEKRLVSCDQHDFQPIIKKDGSASLHKCTNCGGLVDAHIGVRYALTGALDE